MESLPKDTLNKISERLNAMVLTRRIAEMYYNSNNIDIEPYKNYTIIEYIQLYKTNRMLELGVINEKEHNCLMELFAIRKYLNNKLVSELIRESSSENIYIYEDKRYVSKNKKILSSSIQKIDEELSKYNLNMTPLELEKLIDYSILGEKADYQNTYLTDLNELESLTNQMRELKL